MTSTNTRKTKIIFTTEQRLEYAKLMVDEGYSFTLAEKHKITAKDLFQLATKVMAHSKVVADGIE